MSQKKYKPNLNTGLRFQVTDPDGYLIEEFRTKKAAEMCKGNYDYNFSGKATIEDTLKLKEKSVA